MHRLALATSLLITAVALGQEPSFRWLTEPPTGLPPMPLPSAYEPTRPMFDLGRRLFHDGILSRDRTVSCASCHPAPGFASPEPRPRGVGGRRAAIHAPTLFNRGYGTRQRWTGRTPTLEAFVLEPIADPNEMALSVREALRRLASDPGYRRDFEAAFGSEPDEVALRRSLATFVRGIVRGNAPYDRFLRGEREAMTDVQRRGLWLFESRGGCWRCHTPGLFTDDGFHNTGVGAANGVALPGRADVTGKAEDRGRFKTPTLRGVALTAPYMHDGSLATLSDVIDFYARGGGKNDHLSPKLRPIELSEDDRRALVAFLRSL